MSLNPPSLLLARTPALPSTSTSSTHMASSRSDYAHPLSSTSASHHRFSPPRPSRAEPIANLHPAFTPEANLPGTVEIRVEATTFLVHKEIMVHASPFFEVLLCGEWAETTNLLDEDDEGTEAEGKEGEDGEAERSKLDVEEETPSTSPIPSPLLEPGEKQLHRLSVADSFVTSHTSRSDQASSPDDDPPFRKTTPTPSIRLRRSKSRPHSIATQSDPDSGGIVPPLSSLTSLDATTLMPGKEGDDGATIESASFVDEELGLEVEKSPPPAKSGGRRLDARIHLKEEQALAFQDLLMFVYPQSECVCTWNNAPELMTMARKFDMPLLRRHVLHFLLSSAAGKPIQAMRIAEEHQLAELYRESSRFLLDNWSNWDPKELETLSAETLLKLEKKRTWFLERLLKLGLVNSSRDYVCPASCLDPEKCARSVDEKWRSAWAACFRFGPPQPSSIYRALRCLEPSLHSPALLLPHTSCQQHAQRWFADLVDRMFGLLGIAATAPSTALDAARKAKYFLAVEMYETPVRERKWTGVGLMAPSSGGGAMTPGTGVGTPA